MASNISNIKIVIEPVVEVKATRKTIAQKILNRIDKSLDADEMMDADMYIKMLNTIELE